MDIFLFHGKIWRGEGQFADAMVIRRGRILAVGREQELYPRAEGCAFLSCEGRTVIPGIFDACLCLAAAASPLPEGRRGLKEAVRGWLAAHPWFAKKGARLCWRSAGQRLTREEMDDLWSAAPLVLEDVAGETAWANSRALERLEKAGVPAAAAPYIGFGPEGRMSGEFRGPACRVLADSLPRPPQGQVRALVLDWLQKAARAGITTVQSMDLGVTLSERDLPVVRQLYRERDDLPRLRFFTRKFRGLREDFAGRLVPPEGLSRLGRQAGQPVAPVNGGPALETVLECLRRQPLPDGNPRRLTLLGAACTDAGQLREMGELALGVVGFPGRMERTLEGCAARPGAELDTCCAWRTLPRLGAKVAFGGLDSLEPFAALEKALCRSVVRPGGIELPSREALTLEEGLTAWTAGAAWTGFLEDALGRLERGYQADLLVLDRDIFTCSAGDLARARPVLVMSGGRVLWRNI